MMQRNHSSWRLPLLCTALLALGASGCQLIPDKGLAGPASEAVCRGFNCSPRIRFGAYPCAIVGTPYIGPKLGTHRYHFGLAEKNGIAYTCRGGHIDIMHLRIAADWTAYLVAQSYRHLMRGDPGFSYKMVIVDRSRHYVTISYPENWQSLPEEQRSAIAREVALAMGPYMAFSMVTWHEILTWYGFKSIGLPTEFPSAFSWEDSYSNLLGTVVAAHALRDTEHPYNEAMKIALDAEMQTLGIQPARVSKQAAESVRGRWYTGRVTMLVDMRKRNLDIGVHDGLVTPTLVPNVPSCEGAQPASYPAPTLETLSKYGFSAHVEIEPHEWEKGKILRLVYPNGKGKRIIPAAHFPVIMADIERHALEKWGPQEALDAPKQ